MKRNSARNHGEVFTDLAVVDYLLDQVGYKAERDLSGFMLLEPAAGHGSFAIVILQRLYSSSKRFGFSFLRTLQQNIVLIERDEQAFIQLKARITAEILSLTGNAEADLSGVCRQADFLTTALAPVFDGIVGNPPYVRHERIPDGEKAFCKTNFKTFKYRADLYIPFFERGLKLLKPNGLLTFICSNRWLTNQYGQGLRQMIASDFHLVKLLNIEKASPFDEAVTAYPCITVVENTPPREWTLYADNPDKLIDFENQLFQQSPSPKGPEWDAFFLKGEYEHAGLHSIESQGFKIGIGVATGADEVFILPGNDLHGIEPDQLLPIVSSADLRHNELNWSGKYLVHPYDVNGLCRLANFPMLEAYLLGHKERLMKRHTAQKSTDKWYKTIDRVYPPLKDTLKILLPDLASGKFLMIDKGHYYPHHNLYYITGDSLEDLKVLACLLMSGHFRAQISKLGVRMNGGFPRLQSQLLRKLRLPLIAELDEIQKGAFVRAYDQRDLKAIDGFAEALIHPSKDCAA